MAFNELPGMYPDSQLGTSSQLNCAEWTEDSSQRVISRHLSGVSSCIGRGALTLYICCLGNVGTGGIVSPEFVAATGLTTGGRIHDSRPESSAEAPRNESEIEVQTTAERISRAKHILGLNTTELAAVLQVGRPTIYAWTRGEAQPHVVNRIRIDRFCEIAEAWLNLSEESLQPYLRESLGGGRTLYSLLLAENLDVATIGEAFSSISEKRGKGCETQEVTQAPTMVEGSFERFVGI